MFVSGYWVKIAMIKILNVKICKNKKVQGYRARGVKG